MACETCLTNPATGLKHLGKLCRDCLAGVIVKRARKAVREYGGIAKNASVQIIDDNTLKGAVSRQLFTAVFKNLPVQFVHESPDVRVVPLTTDDLAEGFLNELFQGRVSKKPNVLSLLAHITDEELQAYARVQGISGELPERTLLGKKIDTLESRYPGLKFGLVKSREELP